MSRAVWLTPFAEGELAEVVRFYSAREPGLGDVFLLDLAQSAEAAAQSPEAWPIVDREIVLRRFTVGRFAYHAYYTFDDRSLRIWTVIHAHRHPKDWQEHIDRQRP